MSVSLVGNEDLRRQQKPASPVLMGSKGIDEIIAQQVEGSLKLTKSSSNLSDLDHDDEEQEQEVRSQGTGLRLQISTPSAPNKRASAYSLENLNSPTTPGNDYTDDSKALSLRFIKESTELGYVASMQKILKIYDLFKAKEYMRGWLYKKNDILPDGKKFQSRDWMLYYVSHKGSLMTFWRAPDGIHLSAQTSSETGGLLEIENAAEVVQKLTNGLEPNFININDATVDWIGVFQKLKQGKTHKAGIFSLNTSGANRFFLQPIPTTNAKLKTVYDRVDNMINQGEFDATDDNFIWANQDPAVIFLHHWVAAIKIAAFEESLLSQLYTDVLVHCRRDLSAIESNMFKFDDRSGTNPAYIVGDYDLQKIAETKVEGYLQVRVAGMTEWKQYYCVVERRNLQGKNLPVSLNADGKTLTVGKGHMIFFENQKEYEKAMKKSRFSTKPVNPLKYAIFELANVAASFAVFPEKAELVNMSTIFKIEGGNLILGSKAPKSFMNIEAGKFDFGQNIDQHSKKQTSSTIAPNFILCMAKTQAEMARWLFGLWSVFGLNGKGPSDFQSASRMQDPEKVAIMPAEMPFNCLAATILENISLDPKDPLFITLEDVNNLDMRSRKIDEYRAKFWNIAAKKERDIKGTGLLKRDDFVIDKAVEEVSSIKRSLTMLNVNSNSDMVSNGPDGKLLKGVLGRSVSNYSLASVDPTVPRPSMSITHELSAAMSSTKVSAVQESPASVGLRSVGSSTSLSSRTGESSYTTGTHTDSNDFTLSRSLSQREPKRPLPRKSVSSTDQDRYDETNSFRPTTSRKQSKSSISRFNDAEENRDGTNQKMNNLELEYLKLKQEVEILKANGSQVGTGSMLDYSPSMLGAMQAPSVVYAPSVFGGSAMVPNLGMPLVDPTTAALTQQIQLQQALLRQQQIQQQQLQQQQIQQQQQQLLLQQSLMSQPMLTQPNPLLIQPQYGGISGGAFMGGMQALAQPFGQPQFSQQMMNPGILPQQPHMNLPYSTDGRLPSPTPSESASAVGDHRSAYPGYAGTVVGVVPLAFQQQQLRLQQQQQQANLGLISNIPDMHASRSVAYNPRTGVMQQADTGNPTGRNLSSSASPYGLAQSQQRPMGSASSMVAVPTGYSSNLPPTSQSVVEHPSSYTAADAARQQYLMQQQQQQQYFQQGGNFYQG